MNSNLTYRADTLNSFLCRLHVRGAVKIDTEAGFKLKLREKDPTAPLSPLYFNLRVPTNKGGPLIGSDVQEIAEFFYFFLTDNDIKFDAICPVPNAGDPFAISLQEVYKDRTGRDVPIVRLLKEEGPDGRHIGAAYLSEFSPVGARVLLLDDLISRSDSKSEATESLRKTGYVVNDCLVFLDREQGGPKGMADMGVKLHSIVRLHNVLEVYLDCKIITQEQYSIIHSYLQHEQSKSG